MRRYHSILSLLLSVGSLCACGEWNGTLPQHALAQINDVAITVEEFNREFKELILEPEKQVFGKGLASLKRSYLDQVIERKILAQEARRLGVMISVKEMDQALLEIEKDYPGEGLGEKLAQKGITLEEWKRWLEEKLLAEKMMRSPRFQPRKVNEQEALPFYEANRSSFQVRERVRARQIVVSDGEEAIQLLKRLKKGERFEKLARAKSLGPEKINGGDLGYFTRGEKPPEFDHVFTMELGSVSEVIKSPYGYHIFKLEGRASACEIPFEEARPRILQKLFQKQSEQEYETWLKSLKEKAKVKINERMLKS
jgi:peptidyl-prolyl cis-trans isomerase C